MDNMSAYFSTPPDYFWQWMDKGDVIDLTDTFTICYTGELQDILSTLAPQGWPSLGSILVILCGCKDDRSYLTKTIALLRAHGEKTTNQQLHAHLKISLFHINRLLEIIQQLPKELRSGKKRALLINTLFEGVTPVVNSDEADRILHFFYPQVFTGNKQKDEQLNVDLQYLIAAARQVTNSRFLEMKLRTNLEQLPILQPEKLPAFTEQHLFTQLYNHPQTVGIGRLAQRLLSALQLPLHTIHRGDQPLGGITDIINKGNYDHLLISELAQEDAILTARIAHQEALYYRRETLPAQPDKYRVILTDASLKMWGAPRIFALSAALASSQQPAAHIPVKAYTLSGTTPIPADLNSVNGIIQALTVLDHHLHSAQALEKALQQEDPEKADCFLITSEDVMRQPSFQQTLARLQYRLHYLITVHRNGQFNFYEYRRGQKYLRSSALLPLEELLSVPVQGKNPVKNAFTGKVPAFILQSSYPLRVPALRLKRLANRNFYTAASLSRPGSALCITSDLRVLYWPEKAQGAIELSIVIEKGSYCFGVEKDTVSILVHEATASMLYIHTFQVSKGVHDKFSTAAPARIQEIAYQDHYFHIRYNGGECAVSALTGKTGIAMNSQLISELATQQQQKSKQQLANLFRFINNSYSTLVLQNIFINHKAQLYMGSRPLQLNEEQLWLGLSQITEKKDITVTQETVQHPDNPHVIFTQYKYANGVTITADSRGLLHLQCHYHELPEVTIITVIQTPLAAWASDHTVCGNQYFIHNKEARVIPPTTFYHHYIEPYIEKLK
ncbi:hypothetical protein ACDQ55_10980 [Chitinophaga sp. 30R24]|uniref:hypothetical protein n=1 Tax=Chitinophaga sp. 30R24 TaxID=3248838 RepID=UPI003B8F7EA8